MSREVKRVALDFEWPMGETYTPLIAPDGLSDDELEEWVENKHGEPPKGEGWQLWSTVCEGCPLTPVYATSGELIEHMSKPLPPDQPFPLDCGWSRKAAENMVLGSGYAPSFVFTAATGLVDGVTFGGLKDDD